MKSLSLPGKNVSDWFGRVGGGKPLSLGVDAGTSALRYVLYDTVAREVLKWGQYSMEPSAHGGEKPDLRQLLRDLARRINPRELGSIQVNIQGASIAMGSVRIPAPEAAEEKQRIRMALRDHLSFNPDDAVFTWRAVPSEAQHKKPAAGPEAKRTTYHFTAAEKNTLSSLMEPYVDFFHLIPNLSTQGYAHEALVQQCRMATGSRPVAFINIGRGITAISIFRENRLVFQRDIPLAGQDMTRSILILYRDQAAPGKMLDLGEAEAFKRQVELPKRKTTVTDTEIPEVLRQAAEAAKTPSDQLFQSVQGVLTAWLQDVRLTFHHFYENYDGEPVEKIFLMGGSANMKNLIPYLSAELQTETHLLTLPDENPVAVRAGGGDESLETHFHEYATALALAMKTGPEGVLNLRDVERIDYSRLIIPLVRLGFVFVFSVLLTWYVFLMVQTQSLKDVTTALENHNRFLKRIQSPYLLMIRWKKFIDEAGLEMPSGTSLLKLISRTTPENMLINSIVADRQAGQLHLEGQIYGDPRKRAVTIADFTKALKEASVLGQIEVPDMSARGTEEGTFRISAMLKETGS